MYHCLLVTKPRQQIYDFIYISVQFTAGASREPEMKWSIQIERKLKKTNNNNIDDDVDEGQITYEVTFHILSAFLWHEIWLNSINLW